MALCRLDQLNYNYYFIVIILLSSINKNCPDLGDKVSNAHLIVSQCSPKGRGVVVSVAELLRNEWKREFEGSGKVTSSNIENTQALND